MNVKNIFPNAEYIECNNALISGDKIYLTKDLYIQVLIFIDKYVLRDKTEILFESSDLQKTLFEAKVLVQPGGRPGLN